HADPPHRAVCEGSTSSGVTRGSPPCGRCRCQERAPSSERGGGQHIRCCVGETDMTPRFLLAATSALALAVAPAAAADFLVNSFGDQADANPGDGACATSGGTCTLRA